LQIVQQARDAFNSGKTRPLEWRIRQMKQAIRMLKETSSDIIAALASDLRRVCSRSMKKPSMIYFIYIYYIYVIKYIIYNILYIIYIYIYARARVYACVI